MRVTDEMVEAAQKQLGFSPADGVRLRAALEAALAVEGTPKVKALEWQKDWRGDLDDIPVWRAETPWGRLSFSVHGYASHDAAPIERTEAAKAEVQADYEKRVLSCLDYTTPPAGISDALAHEIDCLEGALNVPEHKMHDEAFLRASIINANNWWPNIRAALRGQS